MAKADGAKSGAGASSTMPTLLAVALLTLIGGGGGAYLGYTIAPAPGGPGAGETKADADPHAGEGTAHGADRSDAHGDKHGQADAHGDKHGDKPNAAHDGKGAPPAALAVKELPAIVTNLAEPATSWIRLQGAVVYDSLETPHPEHMIAEVASDVTAYLSTLRLESLAGPEGLRRLQEDLGERAAIRSERKIRQFIIETMVVQ